MNKMKERLRAGYALDFQAGFLSFYTVAIIK